MQPSRFVVAAWVVLSAAASAVLGIPSARADGPAVVVIVEAVGTHVDATRLRAGIEEQLGIHAISVLERPAEPPLGVLAVAVTEGGHRAAIQFVPAAGVHYATMVEVRATRLDRDGRWLVAPCVSVVRSSNERRAAHEPTRADVDPWITSHAIPASAGGEPRTSIDPWAGLPRTSARVWVLDYHVAEEVEDPWAQAVSRYQLEQQQRIAPPARPRRTQRPGPDPG